MLTFVELLLNGIVQGCLLALICVGYSLAYGSARVLNFAHADVMVAGGGYLVFLWVAEGQSSLSATVGMATLFAASVVICMPLLGGGRPWLRVQAMPARILAGVLAAAFIVVVSGRMPFFVAAVVAVPFTGVMAAAVYRVAYSSLTARHAPRTSVLLAALAVSIALQSVLLILWGSQRRAFTAKSLPSFLSVSAPPENATLTSSVIDHGIFRFSGGLLIPVHDLLIVLVFIFVVIGMGVFFRRSRTADAIVAAADSEMAALACGIPVGRVIGRAFFLGGAVASLGGTLFVLRSKAFDPSAGFGIGVLAFAACVLGGIGSLRGSIAGAFLASLVMSLAPLLPIQGWVSRSLPESWLKWLPSLNPNDWSYGVVYLLMVLVILVRPRGLFSK